MHLKTPEIGKLKLSKNYTTLIQSHQTQKAQTIKRSKTSETKSKQRKEIGYKKP
jgi:hypothetical protein